jgi:hypothetical protein
MASAIGLEMLSRGISPSTSAVVIMLAQIEQALAGWGATSRQLLCVVFGANDGQIQIMMRTDPLFPGYPEMATVLGEIARTCVVEGIGIERLRRIVLSETEVRLDLVDASGRPEIYLYPIRPAVLDS